MALYEVKVTVVLEAGSAVRAALLADDAAEEWEAWPHVRAVYGGSRVADYVRPLTPEEASDYADEPEIGPDGLPTAWAPDEQAAFGAAFLARRNES